VGGRVLYRTQIPGTRVAPQLVKRAIRGITTRRRLDGAVLCSVVPSRNRAWSSVLRREFGEAPLVVSHRINLGVGVEYPRPATIGADRLANACGAADRYGVPVIVADFGTALTFDVISRERAYVGGVIAPGLPLMSDYLAEKAALLPHIRLQGRCGAVGKSTAGAMRIGAKIGHRGMVHEITEYLVRELDMPDAHLCATGGYAAWALEGLDMPFVLDKDLTLYGLGRIYELNRGTLGAA